MTDTAYTIFDIDTDKCGPGSVTDTLIKDGRAYDFGEGDANGLTYIAVPDSDKDTFDIIRQAHPDAPIFDIAAPSLDEARDRYQEIMQELEAEDDWEEEEEEDDFEAPEAGSDGNDLPASSPTPTKQKPAPVTQPATETAQKPKRPRKDDLHTTRGRYEFIKGMKARREAAAKKASKPNP